MALGTGRASYTAQASSKRCCPRTCCLRFLCECRLRLRLLQLQLSSKSSWNDYHGDVANYALEDVVVDVGQASTDVNANGKTRTKQKRTNKKSDSTNTKSKSNSKLSTNSTTAESDTPEQGDISSGTAGVSVLRRMRTLGASAAVREADSLWSAKEPSAAACAVLVCYPPPVDVDAGESCMALQTIQAMEKSERMHTLILVGEWAGDTASR